MRLAKVLFYTALLLVLLFSAGFLFVIKTETGRSYFTAQISSIIQETAGKNYQIKIGDIVVGLDDEYFAVFKIRDVQAIAANHEKSAITIEQMNMRIDPLSLFSSSMRASSIFIEGMKVDVSELTFESKRTFFTGKISDVEPLIEQLFSSVGTLTHTLRKRTNGKIRFSDLKIKNFSETGKVNNASFRYLEMKSSNDHAFKVTSILTIGQQMLNIKATFNNVERGRGLENKGDTAHLSVVGFDVDKVLQRRNADDLRAVEFRSKLDFNIVLDRKTMEKRAQLNATLKGTAASLIVGGITTNVHPYEVSMFLVPERPKIEMPPFTIQVGDSFVDVNGGFIDLQLLEPDAKQGIVSEIIVTKGLVAQKDVDERPVPFVAQFLGKYMFEEKTLIVDNFTIGSSLGSVYSSAKLTFFPDTTPELSLAVNVERMPTRGIKQFWPFWIAKKARKWVNKNVYGGVIEDGEIRLFVPKGRFKLIPKPLELDENQLQIDFSVNGARFNITGDIPPMRDTQGKMKLRGKRLLIDIEKGTAFFPSNRTAKLEGGIFVVENVTARPLMANADINISAKADAFAELVSYHPINALKKTKYVADDFKGDVSAHLNVNFGLVRNQNPPAPVWDLTMGLEGVSVKPQVGGFAISDLTGKMKVNPSAMYYDGLGKMNGAQVSIKILEPLNKASKIKKKLHISGDLNTKDVVRLLPVSKGLFSGIIGLDVLYLSRDTYQYNVNLRRAKISVPWLGWSKGKNIKAKVSFINSVGKNNLNDIRDINFSGAGFSVKGSMKIKNSNMVAAKFSNIKLGSNDQFSLSMSKKGKVHFVKINGRSMDLRGVLTSLRRNNQFTKGKKGTNVHFDVALEKGVGFNNLNLTNLNGRLELKNGNFVTGKLTGVMSGGHAVVVEQKKYANGTHLTMSTSNAGRLLNLFGFYDKMTGGLLNVNLSQVGKGPYLGSVDLRKFKIVNEEKLRTLVGTKQQTQTLSGALSKRIDVNDANFNVAFANIIKDDDSLQIVDGVIRGPEIGSTFKGTLFNKNDQMNMVGTFMPAYGLNRLFGEIPILGLILGNGKDRGLIGITYNLVGNFKKPKIIVNPISVIAPGVFRRIFEF